MKKTLKTLGISLILATLLTSANTVLAAAADSSYTGERIELFDDGDMADNDKVRTKSKDGKTVDLTWEKLVNDNGNRKVYLYLSTPYKNRKKVYKNTDPEVSAKYIGKTDYANEKYTLKGLTPGRHYVLYMEARNKGKVEQRYTYTFSTTVRIFRLEKHLTKNGSLELFTDVSNYSGEDRDLEWYTNGCISADGVEYFKKEKGGKFKKIGTAAAGKTFTDKNISSGKTYAYKARSYKKINGKKMYSEFSPKIQSRIENLKPKLKISIVDKENNIVKITSDKNNGVIFTNNYYDNQILRYGNDSGNINKEGIDIKAGETVYIKLLEGKKNDGIELTYNNSATDESKYYILKLDFEKSTFSFTKNKNI